VTDAAPQAAGDLRHGSVAAILSGDGLDPMGHRMVAATALEPEIPVKAVGKAGVHSRAPVVMPCDQPRLCSLGVLVNPGRETDR
jgi:hypothetical protein